MSDTNLSFFEVQGGKVWSESSVRDKKKNWIFMNSRVRSFLHGKREIYSFYDFTRGFTKPEAQQLCASQLAGDFFFSALVGWTRGWDGKRFVGKSQNFQLSTNFDLNLFLIFDFLDGWKMMENLFVASIYANEAENFSKNKHKKEFKRWLMEIMDLNGKTRHKNCFHIWKMRKWFIGSIQSQYVKLL